jgi:hypothetical protein
MVQVRLHHSSPSHKDEKALSIKVWGKIFDILGKQFLFLAAMLVDK